MLMTGAITSSLLVVSASALEAAAQAPPISRVSAMPITTPPNEARMPSQVPSADQDQRLHEQLEHVAHQPADEQGRAAGRGDPLGLDDALAPLADQAEAGEEGPEQAELHEQAGDQEGVGVLGATREAARPAA